MLFSHYSDWIWKRVNKIINHYGTDFFVGKTVLELGCLTGEIGLKFYNIGSYVTFCDVREEHLKNLIETCKLTDRVDIVTADLNYEWPFKNKYDIILNMGLLYHLNNLDIIYNCLKSTDNLVLETEVLDSFDDEILLVETRTEQDQAYKLEKEIRPSIICVENILKNSNFNFQRQVTELNSGPHIYDWQQINDKSYSDGKRAFWFCKRNL